MKKHNVTVKRNLDPAKLSKRAGTLIKTRNARIHISSLMLLSIIRDIQEAGRSVHNEVAYIGEITAFYDQETKSQGKGGQYSYGGISSMLNRMSENGFLKKERHAQYSAYSLTRLGYEALGDVS